MTRILSLLALALLSGCSLFPRTVVEVPVLIYPPDQLIQDCDKPPFTAEVYIELVEHILDLNEALDHCNLDKKALRAIKERGETSPN